MSEDRRELLELLAYGRDPDIRPSDRLRAVELLEVMTGGEDIGVTVTRELAHLPDEAIAELADAAQAEIVGKIIRRDAAAIALYPATAAVVRREIGRGQMLHPNGPVRWMRHRPASVQAA